MIYMKEPDADWLSRLWWSVGWRLEVLGQMFKDAAIARERVNVAKRLPPGTTIRCLCPRCLGKRYTVTRMSNGNNDVVAMNANGMDEFFPPHMVRAVNVQTRGTRVGLLLCRCGAYQLRDEHDAFDRGQYATEHHSRDACSVPNASAR